MAELTVMFPVPGPAAWSPVPVDTTTCVPVFSAALSVAEVMTAGEALAVKLALKPVSLPALLMVRSYGSSSQVPERPFGAAVSTRAGRASSQPPDVSMKPPSPPSGPPRTLRLPKARVALSLHRMMRPPSPVAVASAATLAVGAK